MQSLGEVAQENILKQAKEDNVTLADLKAATVPEYNPLKDKELFASIIEHQSINSLKALLAYDKEQGYLIPDKFFKISSFSNEIQTLISIHQNEKPKKQFTKDLLVSREISGFPQEACVFL